MNCYKIIIPGIPIPWKRPAGVKWRYDAQWKQKTNVIEIMVPQYNHMRRLRHLEGQERAANQSFMVKMTFHLPYDTNAANGLKNAKLWGLQEVNQKPDIDNCIKFYLDCGNGIFWEDDKKIVALSAKKLYTENPRTVIEIFEYEGIKLSEVHQKLFKKFSPDELKELAHDIQSISYITPEKIDSILEEDNEKAREDCLRDLAVNLIKFAQGNIDDLKKILRCTY